MTLLIRLTQSKASLAVDRSKGYIRPDISTTKPQIATHGQI